MAKARWHIRPFFFIRFFHINLNLGPKISCGQEDGGKGKLGTQLAEIGLIKK